MPGKVTFSDGSTISYLYSADGKKLRTMHKTGSTTTTTDYCDNVVYENGTPKLLLTEEGYVSLNDKKYHYYLKDHQGNNRVVTNQSGSVEETNHYYPFGGVFASTGNVQAYNYCANNAIRFIDPDGRGWKEAWPHLKNSVSGSVSFGLRVAANVSASGVKVGANVDAGSVKIGNEGSRLTKGVSFRYCRCWS